jgi:hypothetical protein
MIEANIWVHTNDVHEFYRNEGSDFKIVNFSKSERKGMCYFNISITEEQFTFLKLKYGEAVWKR